MDVDQRSPKLTHGTVGFIERIRNLSHPIPKYGSAGIFALRELAILSDLSGDELGRG